LSGLAKRHYVSPLFIKIKIYKCWSGRCTRIRFTTFPLHSRGRGCPGAPSCPDRPTPTDRHLPAGKDHDHRHRPGDGRVSQMVSTGVERKGSQWRRARALCMATGEVNRTPCWMCGRPIDYEFTRQHPLHRLAGTVHHIIGLAQGGDPLDPANLTPAHRGCNTRESNRLRMIAKRREAMRISRNW
jgi:5-methylcytosine-specific restriction endonuclease McrA